MTLIAQIIGYAVLILAAIFIILYGFEYIYDNGEESKSKAIGLNFFEFGFIAVKYDDAVEYATMRDRLKKIRHYRLTGVMIDRYNVIVGLNLPRWVNNLIGV